MMKNSVKGKERKKRRREGEGKEVKVERRQINLYRLRKEKEF